ncbi:alpha/beta-hydrolase [Gloeopeniophorella convolvens]|nr:alpha/beta-hydrolase [Gloeopeniophorella convolvens]
MAHCTKCFQGVRHEGVPEGKFVDIGGVKTYTATPTADYPNDKAVIFLTDAFGVGLINNQLLMDDFARNGFKVHGPDVFGDDHAPFDLLVAMDPIKFDIPAWIERHPSVRTLPTVQKVISTLRSQGVTGFAAVGYCYGGRLTFDLAFTNETVVSTVSHPSLLQPKDLERYFHDSRAPLLINSCEIDLQFGKEKQDLADEILGNDRFSPGYQRVHWPGCEHGFAVRGDMNDAKVKAGKEGAFENAVQWFQRYL